MSHSIGQAKLTYASFAKKQKLQQKKEMKQNVMRARLENAKQVEDQNFKGKFLPTPPSPHVGSKKSSLLPSLKRQESWFTSEEEDDEWEGDEDREEGWESDEEWKEAGPRSEIEVTRVSGNKEEEEFALKMAIAFSVGEERRKSLDITIEAEVPENLTESSEVPKVPFATAPEDIELEVAIALSLEAERARKATPQNFGIPVEVKESPKILTAVNFPSLSAPQSWPSLGSLRYNSPCAA